MIVRIIHAIAKIGGEVLISTVASLNWVQVLNATQIRNVKVVTVIMEYAQNLVEVKILVGIIAIALIIHG